MTERRSPLWRMIFLIISALALGALVLVAACGGDDDDNGGDDGGESPTATSSSEATNGGQETDQPTDNGEPTASGDFLSDIENFANEYENATGVVTYTFTGEGESGTWKIYSEGNKSRVDFESDSGTFISITTPDASYTCTESDGEGLCFEGDGGIGTNPFAGLFTSFASYDAVIGYIDAFADVDVNSSSENIAGVDANCYSVSGDLVSDQGTIEWCWSDSGLLLLASYQLDSGAFEMRATDYSDSVPGGSFDPPYDVTSFGQ